jgi:hypothetical protein
MLLWGNANHNFNQATMGYAQDSDFGGVSAQRRGWEKQHLVGYMESHDEERLMYKNIQFGNQSASYSTRDSINALKRMGMAAAFWSMIPGPKMLWQFGELGFPYSINTCTNGTVNNNCRLDNKNPVWHFYNDVFKRGLFDVYANLLRLRNNPAYLSAFTGNNYTLDLSGTVKTMQVNDDALKIVVVGNFDISAKTATVNFPANGTWYDYFNKTSVNISGGSNSFTLQPGQYHVFFNKDLSNSLITSITGPALPSLDANARIIPNPVTAGMKINFRLSQSGPVTVELINSEGKSMGEVYKGILGSGQKELSVSPGQLQQKGLKSGIYTLLIRTAQAQQALRFVYGK